MALINSSNYRKPPLGLKPKKIWDLTRLQEIVAAMTRYAEAGMEIPSEWVEEHNEIIARYELN